MDKQKIIIACGGPSAERGISLNSARSVYDNLDKSKYEISIVYFNPHLKAYKIPSSQIYSNTPLDFDYKLHNQDTFLENEELITLFQSADLVFPAIHGTFGEDGQLQKILEDGDIKFTGSGSFACQNTSNKDLCQQILRANNFYTIEGYVVKKGETLPELSAGKYVAKPLSGGSSIGVEYFQTPDQEAGLMNKKIEQVFSVEDSILIEPYVEGTEFTIIILENSENEPVALYPTEIEFNLNNDKFFNYRKKYLATDEVRYHTPARFNNELTTKIRLEAERAFKCLKMKDFARIDGWVLKDGTIWFSDVNAISGMEQNSFLFQQAALFGISHRQLLDFIINKKITPPTVESEHREDLPIIFGGKTAEKQVSVMSGTNVWMKLKSSSKYRPIPLFQDTNDNIYHIPQFLCLHHTVEEIEEKIIKFQNSEFFASLKAMQQQIFEKLHISENDIEEDIFIPFNTNLQEIAQKYKFLFLGLHGGDGENGIIQSKLETLKLPFNGPGSKSSNLCMDKFETGEKITEAKLDKVRTAKKIVLKTEQDPKSSWNNLLSENFNTPLILKPKSDGCSAGVIRVDSKEQFIRAMDFLSSDHSHIPEKAIHELHPQIELPKEKLDEILIEEFILTDSVKLNGLEINWTTKTNIIEVTVGVIGEKGNMKALKPSQTIASQEILSLEEKFMGGTGINLTPPPYTYVNPEVVRGVQDRIKQVANILEIEGYSRIDAFMNIKTGDITIIEANTLPGLTPSTVIFHQALAEDTPMTPLQFIEKIIEIGKRRYSKNI